MSYAAGAAAGMFRNLMGKTFGRLTVLRLAGKHRHEHKLDWVCKCSCGKTTIVFTALLTTGGTKSCGCLQRETRGKASLTHGLSSYPEYKVFQQIIQRCYNTRNPNYQNWGKRGITVCERWRKSFAAFMADMGRRPSPGHQIDRIDNNGNYEPANCRWVSRKIQCRNRRTSKALTRNGETKTLAEWSELTGIKRTTLGERIRLRGMSIDQAINAG